MTQGEICDLMMAHVHSYGKSKLAKDLGVRRQQISVMFGPKGNPCLKGLSRVAERLGLTLEIKIVSEVPPTCERGE